MLPLPLLLLAVAAAPTCPQSLPVPSQDAPLVSESSTPRSTPVDLFHPRREEEVQPAYGGSVTLHLARAPRTLNYMLDNTSFTRALHKELHEFLLRRDWEAWDLRPVLCTGWETEDTLILAGGRGEQNANVLFGKVTLEDEAYVVHSAVDGLGGDEERTQRIAKEDVESLERETVFTFHLRRDVLWHDGHPFDADDVLFSLEAYQNPFVECGPTRAKFEKIVHAEKLDQHTVRFFYAEQYFNALEIFSLLFLLPSHLYDRNDPDHPRYDPERPATDEELGEEVNGNEFNDRWVGLGPYRLRSFDEKAVVAERFDEYFDPEHAGYLDEIRWRILSNDYTVLQALVNGVIDFTDRIGSSDYFGAPTSSEGFRERFVKGYYYIAGYNYMAWNMRRPLFADLRVRKALAHAMDLDGFRRTTANGLANLPTGPMFFDGPAYDHGVERLSYDPGRAEELLAEAGWYDRDGDGVIDKDGVPFRFELLAVVQNRSSVEFFLAFQEALAAIGVQAEVVKLEWGSFMDRVYARNFDAAGLAWTVGVPEDDPLQLWHSSRADAPRSSNHPGVADPKVDALIERGQLELDDERRWELWRELHRYLYEEVQPYLYRLAPPRKFGMSNRFRGVQFFNMNPGYSPRRWFLPAGTQGTRSTLARD